MLYRGNGAGGAREGGAFSTKKVFLIKEGGCKEDGKKADEGNLPQVIGDSRVSCSDSVM